MTTSSGNTQTTYRLNVNTPRTDYYSEKGGYGHLNHHGYDTNTKSNPKLNLSTLSPIATSPTSPNTPCDSIFGQAGNNNNNPSPSGKRYIDTRKRKKQQKKEEKASIKKRMTLFSNERTFIHWIKFGMLLVTIQVSSLMDHNYEPSIYLNDHNLAPHALPPLTPSPSTPPPSATIRSNETELSQPFAPSPAPEPSPALPQTQPQRPVFDIPYLPPGSTILIDNDEDDGSEFESSDHPSDLEHTTVTTASTSTDSESGSEPSSLSESSSDKDSVPSSSRTKEPNVSGESDRLIATRDSSGDEDDDN
ncbi:hypothetical protein BGX30_001579 [Mortierella sp. GBA39]|nr:hypothetical protein BGX30_001579 [Mortierella sp. GBA39]